MINFIIYVSLFSISAIYQTVAVEVNENNAVSILSRAEQVYESFVTLKAEFDINISVPILEKNEETKGTLYFHKPNLLRMNYTKPKGQTLVSDGENVWLYLPQEKPPQIVRSPIDKNTGGFTPMQFLENASEKYVPTLLGEEELAGQNVYMLSLEIVGQEAYYRDIKVWIDKTNGLLRKLKFHDVNGNETVYELRTIQVDQMIDEGKFTFVVPEGVEVYYSPHFPMQR